MVNNSGITLTKDEISEIRKSKLKRALFIIAMIIVPLANFFIFYLYVNISSILMAFQDVNGNYTFEVLGNVVLRIFGDDSDILVYLGNTMIYFLNSLIVMMPLTTIIAYFIYKKIFLYKFFRVIFFLPSIISSVVFVMLYKELWAANGPLWTAVVNAFNLPNSTRFFTNELYAKWIILIYTIWTGFGTNLILMTGAMIRIPEDVLEAAQLDGISCSREVVSIILPLIWPTLTTLMVLAFTGLFTASGPLLLFTDGEADTMTISYYIFREVKNGGDLNFASAMGLFFTLVGLPIIMGVKKLLERWQDAIEY